MHLSLSVGLRVEMKFATDPSRLRSLCTRPCLYMYRLRKSINVKIVNISGALLGKCAGVEVISQSHPHCVLVLIASKGLAILKNNIFSLLEGIFIVVVDVLYGIQAFCWMTTRLMLHHTLVSFANDTVANDVAPLLV